MMTIIVVRTCDGDVYFGTDRNRKIADACLMAAEQVAQYDIERYDAEDTERVRIAHASGNLDLLKKTLIDVGVIREARVN